MAKPDWVSIGVASLIGGITIALSVAPVVGGVVMAAGVASIGIQVVRTVRQRMHSSPNLELDVARLITRCRENVEDLARTGCKDEAIMAASAPLERECHGWILRNRGAGEAAAFAAAQPVRTVRVGMRTANAHVYQRAAGKLDYLVGLQARIATEAVAKTG